MCELTQETALARLRYDEETGKLLWISVAKNKARLIGKEAGRVEANGYCHVKLNGNLYASHRLIWLMHKGKWPEQMIDHESIDQAIAARSAFKNEISKGATNV